MKALPRADTHAGGLLAPSRLARRDEVDLRHPGAANSRFRVSLSMQTAEPSTSHPTYGTSRHSRGPGPSRPRRTGRGGPGRQRRRRADRRRASPRSSRRRCSTPRLREISTSVTWWPASARPAATEAPERSETSCSLDRPPDRTATLMGWSWSARSGWSAAGSAGRRRSSPRFPLFAPTPGRGTGR